MNKHTIDELRKLQAMPLNEKWQVSIAKIMEAVQRFDGEFYVSFSGGKDSTVLAYIVAQVCKMFRKPLYLVFVNTGLEYPEIQKFVKTFAEWLRNKFDIEVHLEILRPKMRFDEVIKKYGYPIISKEVSLKVDNARKGGINRDDFIQGTERETRCGGRYSLVRYSPLLNTDFKISNFCCNVMKKNPSKDYEKETGRIPVALCEHIVDICELHLK